MRIALVSLATLLLAGPAVAAAGPPAPAGEMQEIFRLSGLEAQLGSLDQVVAASLSPSLQNVPAAQAARVKQAVLAEFSGPALQQQVVFRLEKVHHPTHAAGTLRWLRSPLGRRITELEAAASTGEGMRGLEAYARQLGNQPAPETRVALARELDRAIGATDFALELSLASARAAMSAMSGVLPGEQRLAKDQIEAAIDAQREQLHAQLAQISLVSTLYTYRSLEDTELEAYLAFTRGEAGRWYHGVVKQALLETLTQVAERMGRSVASALQTAPAAPPARRAQ